MSSFNNLNDLKKYIVNISIATLKKEVSDIIKQTIEEYMESYIYSKPESLWYQRTCELMNSIDISNINKIGKNSYNVEIFFNESKMNHFSLWGDSSEGIEAGDKIYLPYYLNEGLNKYMIYSEGFFDDSIKNIEDTNKHLLVFMFVLKTKGINISKVN